MNLYVDLASWARRYSYDEVLGTPEATELEKVIEESSREADHETGTTFYAESAVHLFDGASCHGPYLDIPDLISISELAFDRDGDGVFETVIDSADYYTVRPNHRFPYEALPKRRIVLDLTGAFLAFPHTSKSIRVTGVWGYSFDYVPVATLGAAIANGVVTAVTPSSVSGFSVGQTLVIDAEQLYVSAVATGLTVKRGANGTTAAAHSNGAVINLVTYPSGIVEAVSIETVRRWKRHEEGFISREPPSKFQGMDADAKNALAAYVRYD